MCDKASDRKTLMVVEDYDDSREVLEMYLRGTEFDVIVCENGVDALKKYLDNMRCNEHSGILMDLALPDINGLRVMSAIREIEKGSKDCVPIRLGIISASGGMVEGIEMVENLEVTLNLPKPLDPKTFVKDVVRWMNLPAPQTKYHTRAAKMSRSGADLTLLQ